MIHIRILESDSLTSDFQEMVVHVLCEAVMTVSDFFFVHFVIIYIFIVAVLALFRSILGHKTMSRGDYVKSFTLKSAPPVH